MTLFHPAEVWPVPEALAKMTLSVGIGTFVGLERKHRGKVGVRTFALTSLIGCMGGLLGNPYGPMSMLFVGLFVGLMNWQEMTRSQRLTITTSAALVVVGFAGLTCGLGHVFVPVAAGIITAAFLAMKEPISGFAGRVSNEEIRSAILLAILACVIYPVLPDAPIDPWGLINLRENWVAVIAIAGIGFVNYILLKTLGPKGMELTAVFGGLVNSRKVIVELMGRARDLGDELTGTAQRGVVLATGSMVLRNALIVALFAPRALTHCAVPFLLMLLTSAALWWRASRVAGCDTPPEISLQSPFRLTAALNFGLVFLALNIAGALAERHLGAASFYVVSFLGGLLSSASSITSAATLAGTGKIPMVTGAYGIIISSITSVLANLPLVITMAHNRRLRHQTVSSLGLAAVSGLAGVAVTVLAMQWAGALFGL